MSHYGHHLPTIMLFETNRNDTHKSNLAASQNVSTAGKHGTFFVLFWVDNHNCGCMEKSNLDIMLNNTFCVLQKNEKKNHRFQT